jgi:hypothetical protein
MKLSHKVVLICVVFFVILSIIESRNFDELGIVDQAENLRWLSSALIQAYASILALVPVISLALMSFSTSRYRSRLVRGLWESKEMLIFYIAIFGCIIYCHIILVNIPGTNHSSGFYLQKYLYIEIGTIFTVISVLYVLLDRIWRLVDADIMDEVFKSLKKEIKTSENTDEAFEEFFSVLALTAESRDLTSLRIGLDALINLAGESEEYGEKVVKMLGDIRKRYENTQEYFCLDAVNRMIERSYGRIGEGVPRKENSTLAENRES